VWPCCERQATTCVCSFLRSLRLQGGCCCSAAGADAFAVYLGARALAAQVPPLCIQAQHVQAPGGARHAAHHVQPDGVVHAVREAVRLGRGPRTGACSQGPGSQGRGRAALVQCGTARAGLRANKAGAKSSPGRPSLCGPVLSGSHLQAASLQSSSDSLRRTGLLPSSAAACSTGPQLRAARAPRFGPYFVSPVIAGLDPASSEPYLAGMDTIGAIETAKDFMVAGTAPDSLYGMCESMWRPDMVRAWHGCSDSSSGWRRGGGSRGGLGLRRSWQPACPSACRCTGAKAGCLALPGSACMCQQTCLLERCTPRAATAAPCARRAGGGGAVRDGVAMPAVRQRPRRAVRLGRRRLRHVRARAWRAGPARASCLLSELPVGCYGMLVWEIVTHPRPARSCRSLLAVADSVRCHQQRAAHAPVAL